MRHGFARLGILLAAVLSSVVTGSAQDRKNEIVIMVEPGAIQPDGYERFAPEATRIRDGKLRQVLQKHRALSSRRAIRSWEQFRARFPNARVHSRRKGELMPPDALSDLSHFYILVFPDSVAAAAALVDLNALPSVISAQLQGTIRRLDVRDSSGSTGRSLAPPARTISPFSLSSFLPNDPYFTSGLTWGFYNPSNRDVDVHAPEAWAIQKGSSNVIIGILDTGMEVTHSDFSGKIVGEYDFIHDDGNAFPDAGDRGPHGMGSAGIAAAKTNDGFGVPGMCGGDGSTPGCSVLSVKTIGEGSRWHNFMEWIGASTDAADGGTWAVANGAVVLNNSWCDDVENHALHEAFRNAFQVGTVVTAGMGNNQQNDEGAWDCNQSTSATAVVPAFYSDIVMAVGATDIQGRRVLRDNGFNWESGRGSHIAVVAPGVNHYSDALQNGFQAFGGTSAATPFVSGLAGLVYSEAQAKGLSFTARDNRQLISRTAKDIGDPGYDVETGWGLIRADSALKMLQPPNQVTFASAGTTTSGCSSLTAIQTWTFWSSFVVRNARRCEVRRNITFDVPYQSAPLMWGRAVTGGGVTPSNPNSEVAYTGVVDGSVTTTGATLKTFVYERGRWMVSTWGGGQLSLHK